MNVAPAAAYEATFGAGIAGLVGTIRLGLLDNQGATVDALSTAGIIETPAGSGVYAATRTSPDTAGQYTLLWSLDGSTAPDQVSIDDLTVTSSAPGDPLPPGPMYGTVDEFARILQINNPTVAQTAAMTRCLEAASYEADSYMARSSPLSDDRQLQLATEVVYERAREHWQQEEVAFGIWENALGAVVIGRDTFARHAMKLLPLKQQFGIS